MKVTIITATYNSADTLADTLESVLSQTWADFEHIIVDGNSSDATMEIVRSYEPKYQGRLRYVSEPDKGLYDAMNKGIRMATGDVIGILNSDDFFTDSNVVEHVAKAFDDKEVDCVFGDIHFVEPDNLKKCVRYYSGAHFRRWQMRVGVSPPHPSFYCRRQVFDTVGYYDHTIRISADYEFMLRALYIHHLNYRYLPVDVVTMRTGGLSSNRSKITMEHMKIYKRHGIFSNRVIDSLRFLIKLPQLFNKPRK